MNFITKITVILFLVSFTFFSCKNEKKQAYKVIKDKEVKKHDYIDIKIRRYEIALSKIDLNNLEKELKSLQDEYKIFLDGDLSDRNSLMMMEAYLNDISVKTLFDEVVKQYEDISFLEYQLTDAFRRIKVLMPDFTVPTVYTYVSGGDFENPIKYTDNNLIIALDIYLGSDYSVYSMWGIPRFVSYRMRRESLAVDCVKEIARSIVDKQEIKNKSLLDHMIYEGKLLYFTDLCLPNLPDSIKIGYTTPQIGWAVDYQGNAWSFLVDQDLLYKTDTRTIQKFVADAPFTSSFSRNSAPRIGHFIGWQIVRECMRNNQDYDLNSLLEEVNSTKILKLSSYKPKKR